MRITPPSLKRLAEAWDLPDDSLLATVLLRRAGDSAWPQGRRASGVWRPYIGQNPSLQEPVATSGGDSHRDSAVKRYHSESVRQCGQTPSRLF